MARRRHDDDDDNPFDQNGILKDGRSFRVPVNMADSWQADMVRSLHQPQQRQSQGSALSTANRPGWRIARSRSTDDQSLQIARDLGTSLLKHRQVMQQAYTDYENAASVAYKNPVGLSVADDDTSNPPTGFGSGEFRARAGDLCTVRSGGGAFGPEGSAGHLRMVNGALVCVADRTSIDAADARRKKVTQRFDPAGRSEGYFETEEEEGDDNGRRDARSVNDRSAVEAAYQEYSRDLENAWRNPT